MDKNANLPLNIIYFTKIVSMIFLSHLKKCTLFFFSITILFKISYAQFNYSQFDYSNTNGLRGTEIGIQTGANFFLGDLGGNKGIGKKFLKDLNLPLTKFTGGIYASIYPRQWFGITVAGNLTSVAGNDKSITTNGIDETYRKDRNIDFKSKISEVYAVIEFYPLSFFNRNFFYDPKLRPYLLAGVGIFKFNPQGSLTDASGNITWYDLQPLHLEGQGFSEYPKRPDYKLTQLNIPLGGGLKYFISETVNLNLELVYRKTFTDYMDDVSTAYIDRRLFAKHLSAQNALLANKFYDKNIVGGITPANEGAQRGNPKNTDGYFSFQLKVGFQIRNNFVNSAVENNLHQFHF